MGKWPWQGIIYLKNGFRQVEGIYEEKIDDDLILCEYRFEIEVLR